MWCYYKCFCNQLTMIHRNNNHVKCHIRKISTIGFIGLGNMGAHMARNLAAKDEYITVYDVKSTNLEQFSRIRNANVAKNLKSIANTSSYLFTMLPNGEDVLSVYTGENGLIRNSKENTVFVDCSTIDPSIPRRLAKIASDKNCNFIDAPVSGGVISAEKGTLTFMAGGCDKSVASVETLLLKMGSKVVRCGSVGCGQATKLCNNLLLGITMVGVAEALNLGIRFGLDGKQLLSVINSSSGRCWSSEIYPPLPNVVEGVPSNNNYKGGFKMNLLIKDMLLARDLTKKTDSSTEIADRALEFYQRASKKGFGDYDFSSIYKYLSENN